MRYAKIIIPPYKITFLSNVPSKICYFHTISDILNDQNPLGIPYCRHSLAYSGEPFPHFFHVVSVFSRVWKIKQTFDRESFYSGDMRKALSPDYIDKHHIRRPIADHQPPVCQRATFGPPVVLR